ncbi:MAG: synthase subunit epsilon [Parcubacteria group bacterium]|nr:synthase subunit epsilon [Parcubacteria group bacterium]
MAKTFHLTIARVGENLFEGQAKSVTVPGGEGVLTILAEHEAFVTPLKPGTIRIDPAEGEPITLQIEDKGLVEVSNNQATVLL